MLWGFSLLSIVLSTGLPYIAFILLRYPSLSVTLTMDTEFFFQKLFPHLLRWPCDFCFLLHLMWLCLFMYVKPSLHCWCKPNLVMRIPCWIELLSNLLMIFLCSSRRSFYNLLLCVCDVFAWFWYQNNTSFIKNLEVFFAFLFH